MRRHSLLLLLSVVGNVVLAGGLVVGWQARKSAVAQPQVVERRVVVKEAVEQRFEWKDLDAPDFETFVKNLRVVGCPEATIRDIIGGELNEIYEVKREAMEGEIAAAPEIVREVLRQRLTKLAGEEAAALAALTGDKAVLAAAPTADSAPEAMATAPRQDGTVLTPAAFLVGNDPRQAGPANELTVRPTDATLDPATAHVLGDIRDGFADAVAAAGTNDPASPIYRERWNKAQRDADEIYSSLFGGDGFLQAQSEAAKKKGR